jgi:ribulose-5-phosphate 4-epimerase/fuculose-1-phosphate aldolase
VTGAEGVIQYRLDYSPGPLPAACDPAPLLHWFRWCRDRGLVGQDPTRYGGYAVGNLSLRAAIGFVISCTQTGGTPELGRGDLAWVQEFDAAHNRLRATGPCRPSSEAMTHGELYRALPWVGAVIHVHTPDLWLHAAELGIPVTDPAAGYGTPEMAAQAVALATAADTGRHGIFAMGGHEDGIVAYGATMDLAGARLADALSAALSNPTTRGDA